MAAPPFSNISPELSNISPELSTNMESGRSKIWQFDALFHAAEDQRAKTCLDTNRAANSCRFALVGHILRTLLMTTNRPDSISYIELRFLRSDVDVCAAHATAKTPLPSIPFEGFIQSSSGLDKDRVSNWFSAAWTSVRGKLRDCVAYQTKFGEHNDAYEYSLVHGTPALGKGGRHPKVKLPILLRLCVPLININISCTISN